MGIRRAVPDVESERFEESRAFYVDVLGFEVGMEMDWVMTFVSPTNPTAQVILISEDASAPVAPQMSVEVDDVDAVHAEAMRHGIEIVHPLTDEPWGVRRFFARDPNGIIVNVLTHQPGSTAPRAGQLLEDGELVVQPWAHTWARVISLGWVCDQVRRLGRRVAELARELGCDWHTVNDAVIARALWGKVWSVHEP